MSHPLTVFARFKAKQGQAERLGDALRHLVPLTRQEPGSIAYILHRDNADSRVWIVYETWKSSEDLDAHFRQPYMQELLAAVPDLVDREVELTLATAERVGD